MSKKVEYWDSSYLDISFYSEEDKFLMVICPHDRGDESLIVELSKDIAAKCIKDLLDSFHIEIQVYNDRGKLKFTIIVGLTEEESDDILEILSEYIDSE